MKREIKKMTLWELVASTKLQGNIRVSMWQDDEEKIIGTWENCGQLFTGDIEEEWEDFEVDYIFCPGDGFLHIEVKEDD
jgi:hypothetical protein